MKTNETLHEIRVTEVAVTVTMVAMVTAMVERDWEVSLDQWPLNGSDPGSRRDSSLSPYTVSPDTR